MQNLLLINKLIYLDLWKGLPIVIVILKFNISFPLVFP